MIVLQAVLRANVDQLKAEIESSGMDLSQPEQWHLNGSTTARSPHRSGPAWPIRTSRRDAGQPPAPQGESLLHVSRTSGGLTARRVLRRGTGPSRRSTARRGSPSRWPG